MVAQNFPCPPSIPLSSLLRGQKGINFYWEGVNTAATFTLKVPPCHHLGAGALLFLKIPQKKLSHSCLKTTLPKPAGSARLQIFPLQSTPGFSINPPTLFGTWARPGA